MFNVQTRVDYFSGGIRVPCKSASVVQLSLVTERCRSPAKNGRRSEASASIDDPRRVPFNIPAAGSDTCPRRSVFNTHASASYTVIDDPRRVPFKLVRCSSTHGPAFKTLMVRPSRCRYLSRSTRPSVILQQWCYYERRSRASIYCCTAPLGSGSSGPIHLLVYFIRSGNWIEIRCNI